MGRTIALNRRGRGLIAAAAVAVLVAVVAVALVVPTRDDGPGGLAADGAGNALPGEFSPEAERLAREETRLPVVWLGPRFEGLNLVQSLAHSIVPPAGSSAGVAVPRCDLI